MKKVLLLVIVLVAVLFASNVFAQSCSNIGAKDCRVTNPGKCHWWVCDGKSKQWIFSGQSCTCPSRRSTLDSEFPGFMLAQYEHNCASQSARELIISTIKICVPEARSQDSQFTAFLNPSTCRIEQNGSRDLDAFWSANRVFKACMKQHGISME